MGKKKQKVRWCVVDGLKWSSNDQEDSGADSGTVSNSNVPDDGQQQRQQLQQPHQYQQQQQQYPYPRELLRRSSNNHNNIPAWRENLAPRFERRNQPGRQQVYYDGEYCDAEELPNGFTKIRSKNLDILFKRDYYEQKIAQREREKELVIKVDESNLAEQEMTDNHVEASPAEEATNTDTTEAETATATESAPKKSSTTTCSFDQIDPNEIPEFKPMNHHSLEVTDSTVGGSDLQSGQTSPFYPPSYTGSFSQDLSYPPTSTYMSNNPPRPNLYLYSPSNNTLIPCEEIIIPNPVMSSDGPVYAGPTNIYLAYPVTGPDGRGYITQPFSPPVGIGSGGGGAADYVSYSSYSPSMSVDDSQYQSSSTPLTPNSGQDSGSSTQPTSPPPLVNFHPSNWFKKDLPSTPPFLRKNRQNQQSHGSSNSNNCNNIKKIPDLIQSSAKENSGPVVTKGQKGEKTSEEELNVGQTAPYIPGLPMESLVAPKKTQKKKRKKKVSSEMEHRGSTSSETELPSPLLLEAVTCNYQCNSSRTSPTDSQQLDATSQSGKQQGSDGYFRQEPVQEIHLTDDLADFMVNPPTEPECSDEETLSNDCPNLPSDVPEKLMGNEGIETEGTSLPRDDTLTNLCNTLHGDEMSESVNPVELKSEEAIPDIVPDSSQVELDDEFSPSAENHMKSSTAEASVPENVDPEVEIQKEHILSTSVQSIEDGNTELGLGKPADDNLTVSVDVVQTDECITEESVILKNCDEPDNKRSIVLDEYTEEVGQDVTTVPICVVPVNVEMKEEEKKKKKNKSKYKVKEPKSTATPVLETTKNTLANAASDGSPVHIVPQEIPTEPTNSNAAIPLHKSYSAACKSGPESTKCSDISVDYLCQQTTIASAPVVACPASGNSCREDGKQRKQRHSRKSGGDSATAPLPPIASPVVEAVVLKKSLDQWENVPLSVSTPERWERKKDRKRNKSKRVGSEEDDIPAVNEEAALPSPQQVDVKQKPSKQPVEVAISENDAGAVSTVDNSDVTIVNEACPEDGDDRIRTKKSRRKKKHTSEEPEEGPGHRVVICDNQIEIRYSRSVRRASEVLSLNQLEQVRSSGFCDYLVVEKLGCGINRGGFCLGRLYQGKYVPPERVDGQLPPLPHDEQEEEVGEEAGEPVTYLGQGAPLDEADDIDLD